MFLAAATFFVVLKVVMQTLFKSESETSNFKKFFWHQTSSAFKASCNLAE
jgi:hypothetical protein